MIFHLNEWVTYDPYHTQISGYGPYPDFRVPYPDFRVWFKGTIPWYQCMVWRNYTQISGYHTLKLGYQTLKSGYGTGLKILKITVIWPFVNQYFIRIYHFEGKIMTHLDFCDPTTYSKILSWSSKKRIEILNLTVQWVLVVWIFQVTPSFSLFVSFKGIL